MQPPSLHLLRRRIGLIALTLLLLGGCEPGDSDTSVNLQPNQSLREKVEQAAAKPMSSPQKESEQRGRLEAAESLVGGFEVPRVMRLLRRHPDYLVYEIQTGLSELTEFYTGLDRRTGQRFSDREYRIKPQKNGFDVLHSPESLNRLAQKRRDDSGHIYVLNINRRNQHLRIHPPADARRHKVSVSHVGRKPTAKRSGTNAGATAPKPNDNATTREPEKRPDPFRITTSGRPFKRTSEARKQRAHPRQYAPYGRGRVQSMRSRVETWKQNNPGKNFQD